MRSFEKYLLRICLSVSCLNIGCPKLCEESWISRNQSSKYDSNSRVVGLHIRINLPRGIL